MTNTNIIQGTKAETLQRLIDEGFNVPNVYYFTQGDWILDKAKIIDVILNYFKEDLLAVRSSSISEDSEDQSLAGAFESVLNVKRESNHLKSAVENVLGSFDENTANQVLIQPMVQGVIMSGVVMTRVLDDGSPYYVINYDDQSGLTDTVTSGSAINKTVYVFNGVRIEDFDNALFPIVLNLVRSLETLIGDIPLDIEFAINDKNEIHLLQVRRITTVGQWDLKVSKEVSEKMTHLKSYVNNIMQPRHRLFGNRTLLGFMPDWNPAEMIGTVPRPLAMSLYRELITKSNWRIAREKMGYRKLPKTELMVSLFGRPYIDVRNSFNSFLPSEIDDNLSEKLVNAYLDRLEKRPYLHDKVEFDVVFTILDFEFDKQVEDRYPNLLTPTEQNHFKSALRNLTLSAIEGDSLQSALHDIESLVGLQDIEYNDLKGTFALTDRISLLVEECSILGTLPFSILARHGFIAETILRSACRSGALTEDRLNAFRKSITTVSGEMNADYSAVINGDLSKNEFLLKYGHLRPSSYDILSPNYSNRKNIFSDVKLEDSIHKVDLFHLTSTEKSRIESLVEIHFHKRIKAEKILEYAAEAIRAREYAKFVFTKHLSNILELIALWGSEMGMTRDDLSFLKIEDILNHSFQPIKTKFQDFYMKRILQGKEDFALASSFKLSYLLRSERDVYIVPMQRSVPNFVGTSRIERELVFLTPHMVKAPDLQDKIVCIEGADPGYDWIFTKKIAGLITKFGGANSHMAIRSAEYGIPAAIGCGEQTFERVITAKRCLLDCQGKRLEPLKLN